MIELSDVLLRVAPVAQGLFRRAVDVGPLNARFEPGVHGIVALPNEGAAIGAVLGGAVHPHRGRVRVFGEEAASAAARLSLGFVPLEPAGAPLTVSELLAGASRLRGDPPEDVLEGGGLGGLARRRFDSLTFAERRSVLLAHATAAPRVRAIVVLEPLTAFAPQLDGDPVGRLRAWAQGDARVFVGVTTSRLAAERVGGAMSLRNGVFKKLGAGGGRVTAWIATPAAGPLADALEGASGVLLVERHGGGVRALGTDRVILARAIQTAIDTSGVEVDAIHAAGVPEELL